MSDDAPDGDMSAERIPERLAHLADLVKAAEDLAAPARSAGTVLDDLNRRLTDVGPLLKAAEEAATQFAELRAAAARESQGIAASAAAATTALASVEDVRTKAQVELDEATKARAEVAQALDSARTHAEGAKAQAESARQESGSAAENAANSVQARAQADAELTATKEARGRVDQHELSAKKSDDILKGLAGVATENEARVKAYEDQLQALLKAAKETTDGLTNQIRSLLPEATSAGLAAAFEARKATVASAQAGWKILFYFSLVTLAVVAAALAGFIPGLFQLPQGADWHDLGLQLVRRLPLVVAPFWLALFSSRQLKTYLRLEEDYAHKVTMSNSFEGYKRELQGIAGADSPLVRLTTAVIDVLAQPPVRLYDERHGSDTPLGSVAESATRILDSAKGIVSTAAEAANKLRQ